MALPASGQLTLIEVAEDAFSKGKYDEALQRFQEIVKNPFAAPADIAVSQCRIGVVKSIQNDQASARRFLEDSVRGAALPLRHASLCYYALLQIYVLEKSNNEARDLIRKMGSVQLSPIYVARSWALAAEVGQRLGDSAFEAMYLQKLLQVMEKNRLEEVEIKILSGRKVRIEDVRRRLGVDGQAGAKPAATTRTPTAAATAAQLPSATAATGKSVVGGESSPRNGTLSQISAPSAGGGDASLSLWKLLREGELAEARSRLEAGIADKSLTSSLQLGGLAIHGERLLGRVTRLQSEDPRNLRIGVVLPAGSMFTRVNSRILRTLSAFASSSAAKGVNYSFAVRAISPEPGAAELAAVELLLDEHVHAFVGPVSNSQVLGVQSAAALFGVPVMALGPVTSSQELFPSNLVRMGLLARSQATLLLKHLQTDLQFRNAAVLAPDDPFGFEMSSAFVDVAKEMSFPVTSVSYYSAGADVFREPVEVVIGPQDKTARKAEYEELLKKAKKKAQSEKKRFDPKRVLLPPVLNFDALFIPESLTKSRVIASTFAFLGAEIVHYLGDRQWNDGANGHSSIADAFMNGARVPVPVTGAFLNYVRRDLGFSDTSFDLERQAFDALVFLRTAQYRAGGNSPGKLALAMRSKEWSCEGIGVYGPVDATGEPSAKFTLGAYKSGKIESQLPPWTVEDQTKALFELQMPKGNASSSDE